MLHALIASFRRDEEGQGLAEYALILALIAIVDRSGYLTCPPDHLP